MELETENIEDFADKVVNFLKTNGKFDEFRKKCSSEIENHASFVNARREVEELVRLRVVNNRKSHCPLTKAQLRQEIRAMLSKRKDLLAAADSSIQFSLRNNQDLFSTQINEVAALFEEEEKVERANAEARKREETERAAQLASEEAIKLAEQQHLQQQIQAQVQQQQVHQQQQAQHHQLVHAHEPTEDIPPPPPPPPPPNPRKPSTILPVSGEDTARLLDRDSLFAGGAVFAGTTHTEMDLGDLLANVQSSDFAGVCHLSSSVSPLQERSTDELSHTTFSVQEKEKSRSPTRASSVETTASSKQDMAKSVFEFERDRDQYTHFTKETPSHDKYHASESRDYKQERYKEYDYKRTPSHKPSSSSSRKYPEEYRESRSAGSSSKRHERSASPKQHDRYKDYSYGMLKPPEYFLPLPPRTSSSSSSRSHRSDRDREKDKDRERRRREEEWYAKHPAFAKYGPVPGYSSSSHKYPESSSRRSEHDYYKDYYSDKRRYEDPHYKSSSSERSKSRDYALYESSRSRGSSRDFYKSEQDAEYELAKLRDAAGGESSKYKDPPFVPPKYHIHPHEILKMKERDQYYDKWRKDQEAFESTESRRDRTMEKPYTPEKDPDIDRRYKQVQPRVLSPLDLKSPLAPSPVTTPKLITPEKEPTPTADAPVSEEDDMASSRSYLEDMLEKAIANIPKTPEEEQPAHHSTPDEPSTPPLPDLPPEYTPTTPPSPGPRTPGPRTPGPRTPGPRTPGPRTPGPRTPGPRTPGPRTPGPRTPGPRTPEASPEKPKTVPTPNMELNEFEMECVTIEDPNRRAIIDAILPKPKYCSFLTQTYTAPLEAVHKDVSLFSVRDTPFALEPYPLKSPFTSPVQSLSATATDAIVPTTAPEGPISSEIKENVPIPHVSPVHDNQSFPSSSDTQVTRPPSPIQTPTTPNTASPTKSLSLSTQPGLSSTPTLNSNPTLGRTPSLPKTPPPHVLPKTKSPPPPPPSKPVGETEKRTPLKDILSGIERPTPEKPVVLNTIVTTPKKLRNALSSDAEEGEIVSDCEDTVEGNKHPTPEKPPVNKNETGLKETVEDSTKQPEKKLFVPDENFPIRSKRDLFKARFFQPDRKIDFAKPDPIGEGQGEKKTEERAVNVQPEEIRFSRKMRFKEVMQQHIQAEQQNVQAEQKEIISSEQNDIMTSAQKSEIVSSEQKEIKTSEEIVADADPTSQVCPHPPTAPTPNLAYDRNAHICNKSPEPAVSLIGKRKRFLNDYIASLESGPAAAPPAKTPKLESEPPSEESLPKLRIKPLSGGSYSSESLSSAPPPLLSSAPPPLSSAPPPLHKAAGGSPDKESSVPKCIIKLGRGNWTATTDEAVGQETVTGKRKGRSTRALRSREASTDSSKSENVTDKPRQTRSKKPTRPASKTSYVEAIDEDDKHSDNSFEDSESATISRKSGRTRKTIKRLNL